MAARITWKDCSSILSFGVGLAALIHVIIDVISGIQSGSGSGLLSLGFVIIGGIGGALAVISCRNIVQWEPGIVIAGVLAGCVFCSASILAFIRMEQAKSDAFIILLGATLARWVFKEVTLLVQRIISPETLPTKPY